MNPTSFITWVCVFVFAAIAIITILSIVNVVKINESYQKKLFYTLIIEIVVTGGLVFKNSAMKGVIAEDYNIIRITYPGTGGKAIILEKNEALPIWGVCRKQQNAYVTGYFHMDSKIYPIITTNFTVNGRFIFSIDHTLPDSVFNATPSDVHLYIVIDKDTISRDSAYFMLQKK